MGGKKMSIYKGMYLKLFNAVTDAIEELKDNEVRNLLCKAQADCEEMYMSSCEEHDDEATNHP